MGQQRSRKDAPREGLRLLEGGLAEPPEGAELLDAPFVDAFERGDPAATEELYDRLIDTVEGTLLRILGQRDRHHDDLVQSAFEHIVRTLSSRRFERACSLRTFAASVTSHVAFNELRRRTRERRWIRPWLVHPDDPAFRSPSLDTEGKAEVHRVLARVRFHLADMDPDRAHAVFLHDVLGHDLAEIAALARVSRPAAQSRLFRGRKELQVRLARDGFVVERRGGGS